VGKPFGHPGEFVDDVTETLWHPADLELSGVVRDGLDAQPVLACGVALQASVARSGL
jgi:hypothetical protein